MPRGQRRAKQQEFADRDVQLKLFEEGDDDEEDDDEDEEDEDDDENYDQDKVDALLTKLE